MLADSAAGTSKLVEDADLDLEAGLFVPDLDAALRDLEPELLDSICAAERLDSLPEQRRVPPAASFWASGASPSRSPVSTEAIEAAQSLQERQSCRLAQWPVPSVSASQQFSDRQTRTEDGPRTLSCGLASEEPRQRAANRPLGPKDNARHQRAGHCSTFSDSSTGDAPDTIGLAPALLDPRHSTTDASSQLLAAPAFAEVRTCANMSTSLMAGSAKWQGCFQELSLQIESSICLHRAKSSLSWRGFLLLQSRQVS